MNHKQRTENWNSARIKAWGSLCLISLRLFFWFLFLLNKVHRLILYHSSGRKLKTHGVMGAFMYFEKLKELSETWFLRNMSKWHRSTDDGQGDKLTWAAMPHSLAQS